MIGAVKMSKASMVFETEETMLMIRDFDARRCVAKA
jgi:hypothetical protein